MVSDERLLEQLREGDLKAFDLLYERYERPLHGFIRRQVSQRDDAEDLLQEVFLTLVREPPRALTSVRAWLFQIARNLCLNRGRSLRRGARALENQDAPSRDSLEVVIEGQDFLRALREAALKLPLTYAELYQLRRAGLSHQEISSVLSIPVGTVKSRMHELVRQLREALKP